MRLVRKPFASTLVLALCVATLLPAALSSEEQFLTAAITANVLKAHVSFLASDALEGRGTPSKGLDIAAEYIASEFRRAGLEPAGDDGYFQSAPYATIAENPAGLQFSVQRGGQTMEPALDTLRATAESNVEWKDLPLVKASLTDGDADSAAFAGSVSGKAVVLIRPDFRSLPEAQREETYRRMTKVRNSLRESKAAVLIDSVTNLGPQGPRLADLSGRKQAPPPAILVRDPEFRKFVEGLPDGETGATVSARCAAADIKRVTLRNVAGLLRGSDPKLKDTYVIVSGHYDHLGIEGGQIHNGANDDASGTSSMLALAEALARLPGPPRRSILFLAYFGEEKGLLGSRYYGAHPLFPLARTDANINLEQTGRTDDSEGQQLKRVFVTGFDYTNMTDWLVKAGRDMGVTFYKHETKSDPFFGRSDNQSLADSGVPAHTLGVAFEYPDYHQPGDHWDKLDYDNMAAVTRAIGVGLVRLANSPKAVQWNKENPRAENYVKAAEALGGKH